jgi:hypothetical protein
MAEIAALLVLDSSSTPMPCNAALSTEMLSSAEICWARFPVREEIENLPREIAAEDFDWIRLGMESRKSGRLLTGQAQTAQARSAQRTLSQERSGWFLVFPAPHHESSR